MKKIIMIIAAAFSLSFIMTTGPTQVSAEQAQIQSAGPTSRMVYREYSTDRGERVFVSTTTLGITYRGYVFFEYYNPYSKKYRYGGMLYRSDVPLPGTYDVQPPTTNK